MNAHTLTDCMDFTMSAKEEAILKFLRSLLMFLTFCRLQQWSISESFVCMEVSALK
jgi:hypothetical protein